MDVPLAAKPLAYLGIVLPVLQEAHDERGIDDGHLTAGRHR